MPSTRRRTWALLAFCTVAYLYPFPYHSRVNNPNENVRFYMTAALAEEGTYAIDSIRARWGWVNDAAVYEGHYYSVKAPGTSLLGVPAYWLYDRVTEATGTELDRVVALWVVRVTASVLPMLVFIYFLHRWMTERGALPVIRDAVVVSIAIGSLLYAYGIVFVSHSLSAATSFGAFMILERAHARMRSSVLSAFAAGFLAASTTALEYPGFPTSALLCGYAGLVYLAPTARAVVLRWSGIAAALRLGHVLYLIPFALGALLPTAAVLHFHQSAFGNPLTPGHRYLENPEFRGLANEGFFGATELSWDAVGGLLFNLGYGLFPLTPVLLFAVIGYPVLLARRRTRLAAWIALLIPLATLVLISFMNNWRGGWTIGPRYLALVVPFVGWAALEGAQWIARAVPRLVESMAVGATAAGIVASAIPGVYYPHLPESLTRPLPQLIRVLVRNDWAPYNALSWVSERVGQPIFGTAAMIPLAFLALLLLAWICWGERRLTDRLLVMIGASFFGSSFLGPIVAEDPAAPRAAVDDTVSFIVRFWDPQGHDLASQIEARIEDGHAAEGDWERLIRAYQDEGRATEALRARHRARSLGFEVSRSDPGHR